MVGTMCELPVVQAMVMDLNKVSVSIFDVSEIKKFISKPNMIYDAKPFEDQFRAIMKGADKIYKGYIVGHRTRDNNQSYAKGTDINVNGRISDSRPFDLSNVIAEWGRDLVQQQIYLDWVNGAEGRVEISNPFTSTNIDGNTYNAVNETETHIRSARIAKKMSDLLLQQQRQQQITAEESINNMVVDTPIKQVIVEELETNNNPNSGNKKETKTKSKQNSSSKVSSKKKNYATTVEVMDEVLITEENNYIDINDNNNELVVNLSAFPVVANNTNNNNNKSIDIIR